MKIGGWTPPQKLINLTLVKSKKVSNGFLCVCWMPNFAPPLSFLNVIRLLFKSCSPFAWRLADTLTNRKFKHDLHTQSPMKKVQHKLLRSIITLKLSRCTSKSWHEFISKAKPRQNEKNYCFQTFSALKIMQKSCEFLMILTFYIWISNYCNALMGVHLCIVDALIAVKLDPQILSNS